MAKKITEKVLLKKLETMDKEELEALIVELFKSNKYVEEKLSFKYLGEEFGNALLEKSKKKIYKIFNGKNGFSLKNAQTVLSDFSNVCGHDTPIYADLALYFAECATEIVGYGYTNDVFLETLFNEFSFAISVVYDDEQLYKLWKNRLEYVHDELECLGFEMMDYGIDDEYYSIPWREEE